MSSRSTRSLSSPWTRTRAATLSMRTARIKASSSKSSTTLLERSLATVSIRMRVVHKCSSSRITNSISFIKTRKPDKPTVTVTLTEETTIEINGEKATLADLQQKIGVQVNVDVNEKDKTAYSITIREKKVKKAKPAKPQKKEDDEKGDGGAEKQAE